MLYEEEENVNDQSEGNQHEYDNVSNSDIHGSAEPVADFNELNLDIDSGVEGITPAQEREDLLGVEELMIAMEAAPAPAQVDDNDDAVSECPSSQSYWGNSQCNIEIYIQKKVKRNQDLYIPQIVNRTGRFLMNQNTFLSVFLIFSAAL